MANKKICADCGTEYSADESFCPLCGSTQCDSAARQPAPAAQKQAAPAKKGKKPAREVDDGMPKSLVVASTVLVFIAVLALGWHILAQWIPGLPTFGSSDETLPGGTQQVESAPESDTSASDAADLTCREINCETKDMAFSQAGMTSAISVSVDPVGCTDPLTFSSENPAVATVDGTGVVTAVGEGETNITINCGIVSKVVHVNCQFGSPLVPEISESKVEFSDIGQEVTVYVKNLTGSETVVWESEDESVATVDNGLIRAVGDGVCDVKARVDAQVLYVTVKVAREGVTTARADGYLRIREEPDTDAEILIQLEPDDKLIVLGEEGDWYKVSYDDDGDVIEGYAAKDYVLLDE